MIKKIKNNDDGTFQIQIIESEDENDQVLIIRKNMSLDQITTFALNEVKRIDDQINSHRHMIEELKNKKSKFKKNANDAGLNI